MTVAPHLPAHEAAPPTVRVTASVGWLAQHTWDTHCSLVEGRLTDGRPLAVALPTEGGLPSRTQRTAQEAWWAGQVCLVAADGAAPVLVLPFNRISGELVAEAALRYLYGSTRAA